MKDNLNLLYNKDDQLMGSNSFTELRISNLQEPIIDSNEIENLNPNNENLIKSSKKDLNISNTESKNSLFSLEVKISYNTELFQEIEKKNYKKILELLDNNISQINEYNIDGLTPLHLSVIIGNVEIINLLLEKGANPNALTLSKNQSPLHLCYINQNENLDEIIKILKAHGANENVLDINHKKPSDYKDINNNTPNSNSIGKKKNFFKKDEDKLKLNKGEKNKDKNISETNSYENTIIQSISTKKEDKSIERNASLDEQKEINVDINDLITPIKYPCLQNLKEKIQKEEKGSINDSFEIENLDTNINKNNKKNNLHLPQENDIKIYKSLKTNTSYNDNIDLTYTTSRVVDQSNKISTTNKKDNKSNLENQALSISNRNSNVKIDYNSENVNIDEIYKELIIKKRGSLARTYGKKFNKIYFNNNFCNNTVKNKKKKILYDSCNNSINKDSNNNSMKNLSVIHNTNPNYLNKNLNKTLLEYSRLSTESQTGKRKINYQVEDNKPISEFKYDYTEEKENNKKGIITSLGNEFMNKSNNLKNIDENINQNFIKIKKWLSSIELQNYYNNFINNDIYDINILINKMKSYYTKLSIQDIETLLKINKKGHCYRILVKLEIDSGLIDTKIANFMIKNINMSNNSSASKNNLKLSISQDYNCFGCCKIKFLKSTIKNDLKCFLIRYGLIDLFQNFSHNGFELINFVILQMYSDNPITDEILENYFHIYNYEKRSLLLKALVTEMKKINYFLDSNEYIYNPNRDMIKYENITFEENQQNNIINQKASNDCFIF